MGFQYFGLIWAQVRGTFMDLCPSEVAWSQTGGLEVPKQTLPRLQIPPLNPKHQSPNQVRSLFSSHFMGRQAFSRLFSPRRILVGKSSSLFVAQYGIVSDKHATFLRAQHAQRHTCRIPINTSVTQLCLSCTGTRRRNPYHSFSMAL